MPHKYYDPSSIFRIYYARRRKLHKSCPQMYPLSYMHTQTTSNTRLCKPSIIVQGSLWRGELRGHVPTHSSMKSFDDVRQEVLISWLWISEDLLCPKEIQFRTVYNSFYIYLFIYHCKQDFFLMSKPAEEFWQQVYLNIEDPVDTHKRGKCQIRN